jgi:hypothetical protein
MKQLRLTTTEPKSFLGIMYPMEEHEPLVTPNNIGKLIMGKTKTSTAYIHGEAERLAGFDIPFFIDGNLAQLDLPINQQDILLLLPSGEYKCKAEYYDEIRSLESYLITLYTEPSAIVKKNKISI